MNNKIDIVYTWVDGNDSEWCKRKADAQKVELKEELAGNCRFVSHDELMYSIRSVEKFCPWVNTIFIVTDKQTPSWLDTSNTKVKIIDHTEIFGNEGTLPTFNSNAIELKLHHIVGLSEQYIYLNDDMFFGRPVSQKYFFNSDQSVKLRFQSISNIRKIRSPKELLEESHLSKKNPYQNGILNARREVYKQTGFISKVKPAHTPLAFQKSECFKLENKFKNAFTNSISNQFRTLNDIYIGALYLFMQEAQGASKRIMKTLRPTWHRIIYNLPFGRINRESCFIALNEKLHKQLIKYSLIKKFKPRTFCINDGAETKQLDREKMLEFLGSYFPEKSSFEK